MVTQSLSGWEEAGVIDLVQDLHPVPGLCLDPEQILKVITNLVLNAREAVARHGPGARSRPARATAGWSWPWRTTAAA